MLIINKNQIKILSLKKPIILRASCDSEPIYDQVTISRENNVVHNFKNFKLADCASKHQNREIYLISGKQIDSNNIVIEIKD